MVKKTIMSFVMLTAAILSSVSCNDKIETPELDAPADESLKITFHASHDTYSKTVLNDETVLWESGDKVKILWGDNKSYESSVLTYNSSTNAELVAEVDAASAYYGVYPYSAQSSLADGKLTVKIPEQQTGLFADAGITVAKADKENNMRFKHVVSYIEFTIDRTGTLTISGGQPLNGDVKISEFKEAGVPEYSVSENTSAVTLDIKASGTYYVAILPDAKFDYLLLTLKEGETTYSALSTNQITMKPGKLIALGNVTSRFKLGNAMGATLESFEIVDFSFESPAISF